MHAKGSLIKGLLSSERERDFRVLEKDQQVSLIHSLWFMSNQKRREGEEAEETVSDAEKKQTSSVSSKTVSE